MVESLDTHTVETCRDLQRALQDYYIQSCRKIWALIPQEASRKGVELTEKFLRGDATKDELSSYNWYVEGAAFNIDYSEPEEIQDLIAQVEAIPAEELKRLLCVSSIETYSAQQLLLFAAYFVDRASMFMTLSYKSGVPTPNGVFLCADLLRQVIPDPTIYSACGPIPDESDSPLLTADGKLKGRI